MDTTPSPKMFAAMEKLTDALCGGAPSRLEQSTAANAVRNKRAMCMDVLHNLVTLSMREGVNRAIREAHERVNGPRDMADKNAMSQAVEDAMAGRSRVLLPH